MGAPRDLNALILDRLDMLVDMGMVNLGLKPQFSPTMMRAPVGSRELDLMVSEMLLAASLPSAPQLTEEMPVTTVASRLVINESLPLMRVVITNDDGAQPLWISKKGVLRATGRVILAQQSIPFVLPEGGEIWGVCPVPFISVRISLSWDFYNILRGVRRRVKEEMGARG